MSIDLLSRLIVKLSEFADETFSSMAIFYSNIKTINYKDKFVLIFFSKGRQICSMAKYYRDQEYLVRVGIRLASIREKKNISQELLADLTGFDTRQIGRIERAESNSSISIIKKIADVLNVRISDLLD